MILLLLAVALFTNVLASIPDAASVALAVFASAAYAVYVYFLIRRERTAARTLTVHACTLSAALIYCSLKSALPFVYSAVTGVSLFASMAVGAITFKPISLAPTYSGIDVAVFFLIAITAFLIVTRQTARRFIASIGSVLVLWLMFIYIWTILAENSLTLGLNIFEPLTGPLDFRVFLFTAMSILYLYLTKAFKYPARKPSAASASLDSAKKVKAPDEAPFDRNASAFIMDNLPKLVRSVPAYILALSIVLSIVASIPAGAAVSSSPGKIVFLDSGIDFSVPATGKYGLDNVGMFGVLPRYLSSIGFNCETVQTVTADTLSNASALVIFNLMRTPDTGELTAIHDFVSGGGTALVVGDHTGDSQIRLPTDAVLQPVGITLNFDSAIPFKPLWKDSFELRNSPLLAGIRDREIQLVVGASLNIGPNAEPLVIGRTGYSDLGDVHNTENGLLGDMHFNIGERAGDLVLAARAGYGKGQFVVFGDTTAFQNTVIAYSHPFIDRLFTFFASASENAPEQRFYKSTCLVDICHMENISLEKSDDSVDGLIACSLRADVLPLVSTADLISSIDSTSNLDYIFLIEPAAGFSAAELARLDQFIQNGGMVVICADYNSPDASKALAGYFGVSFDNMAIGRVSPDARPEMAFWDACPVLYDEKTSHYSSLIDIWDNSVICQLEKGSGSVVVIGDSGFFMNKNLEGVDTFREGNIDFTLELLRR